MIISQVSYRTNGPLVICGDTVSKCSDTVNNWVTPLIYVVTPLINVMTPFRYMYVMT